MQIATTAPPISGPELESALGESCPFCDSPGKRKFRVHEFWIRECPACSHQWTEIGATAGHVERTYDDSYFNSGSNGGYHSYFRLGQLLRDHGRRYARIVGQYSSPGSLFDVGSAAGFIPLGFQDHGWRVSGVEPNAGVSEYARRHLKIDVNTGTFENHSDGNQFDLVTMIQVLPHFVDPRLAIQRAAELTKPDGLWLIETWDRDSWFARVCGKHWHEYSPPSVLHFFSRAGIRRYAVEHGFVEIASGRPKKRLLGEHAKSILRFKLGSSLPGRLLKPAIAAIPDNVRLAYPSWDLFWSLFRRN